MVHLPQDRDEGTKWLDFKDTAKKSWSDNDLFKSDKSALARWKIILELTAPSKNNTAANNRLQNNGWSNAMKRQGIL